MTSATPLKQPRKGVVVRECVDAEQILPPVPAAAVPHTPEAVAAQYRLAMDGLRECLKFGAMLAEVEGCLSRQTTSRHDPSGEGPSLKNWLSANCPEVDYGWALKYKRLAEGVAEACALPAAVPLSLAMGSEPADGVSPKKLGKARAGVAAFLDGKTARQLEFAFGYRAAPKGGDRRSDKKLTEEEKHEQMVKAANAVWNANVEALVDQVKRIKSHMLLTGDTVGKLLTKLGIIVDALNAAAARQE